ncbi:MAG: peptidylprolyl isomerase [Gammaproteobacteria bacterium]|uniref:FKBP-type peptidyl-prolyl cis-trans isomerase n=1 Tax=Pseudomaricurvus alcaniphilus TaxID=1166482 RepID=UPI00140E7CFC|nr:peptidylprolyl isomerase [Pseudomaricurvus alcaniphilus]MBR9910364.1 peptidylprolyl isomerase [Gammaproteobacteria bacterium]NHN36225.1 peptidylprolyl isomerase [Pseudomaricurvus alcaniphilus]
MQISADKVVSFHYRLREEGGEVFEDSQEDGPVLYLHGHGGMLPGLEEALEGKSEGESFDVTLSPEKGYGQRKEGAVQRVAKKHLLTKGKITPGMVVQLSTEHGPQEATVIKVGLKTLDIDGNHPLAGKSLAFSVDVLEVRDATAEEISHGHAHGAGGHHH